MATTARHSLPTPDSGDVPDVPADTKDLADAVDVKLPYNATAEPAHVDGLIWRDPDTDQTRISDGAAWYPIRRGEAFGVFAISVTAGTSTNQNITFPAGEFSAAPHLSFTVGNGRYVATIASITSTGATVNVSNLTTVSPGTFNIWWHAIETV